MNSTQIKCFLSLARTLNFTKSANELFLSQSTVSKNIKNLEKELQVSLFNRDYHKIELTEQGRVFNNRMSLITTEIDNTIADIQQGTNIERPTVRMGYTDLPFEKKWLPIALRLIKAHTHVQLVPYFVDPGHDRNINALVGEGKIDLMIIQNDIMAGKKDVQYMELFQKGFSAVIPEDDALSLNNTVRIQDLLGKRIYFWNGSDNFPAIESLKFDIRSQNKNVNLIEENDSSNLIAYVRAKMGIGVVPSILYNKADTDIRYVPLETSQKLSYGIVSATTSDKQDAIKKACKYISQAINICKSQW
ncbi:MAG TPA: hypothetical protein DCW31_01105 [Lactobacillus sp.]|nr:hypothetical protein [Lactobacillus sp.]